MRRANHLYFVLSIALVASACGGGSEEAADVTTTAAATSSTAEPSTTTTEPPTTTTEDPRTLAFDPGMVPAPFTGLPLDEAMSTRQALVLKIDNHANARPQWGIDSADMVFDYRAEGVTRFAAVFHSAFPEQVGPVRSSRTADFDILRGLSQPVYGSSGGNAGVIAGLAQLPIFPMTNHTRKEYFRESSRSAPHNLLVRPSELYSAAEATFGAAMVDAPGPNPWFEFRDPTIDQDMGDAAAGPISVDFTGSPTATFEWDAATEGWMRSQDGQPHQTADGVRIAPQNVVIMVTTYGTSSADAASPEVHSTGSGEAVVLSAGRVIAGTWERVTADAPPVLTYTDGRPIQLTPGQTWVLFPEAGQIAFG